MRQSDDRADHIRLVALRQSHARSSKSRAPPSRRTSWPLSVWHAICHVCGPVCRKSNSARTGNPAAPDMVIAAAIGVAQFSGTSRLASTNELASGNDLGQNRQCVDAGIEDAEPALLPYPLLAGMPNVGRLPSSRSRSNESPHRPATPRRGATADASRECHAANSVMPRSWRGLDQNPRHPRRKAAGAFQASHGSPASSAAKAAAWRCLGGWHIDTASISGCAASIAAMSA